ncbi:MAG: NAD(P)-dependent oxidoreductase [Labilithrix sp.]|nr:NAD(P)-dependent oxidoreductase [Labilithrix sp.]
MRRGATSIATVAFIGLGAMGRPMATRLVRSGLSLRVYNRTKGPERALVKLGATACATPAECARGADLVITMLSDAEALAAVLEGPQGVLRAFAAEPKGQKHRPLLIDMSTIGRRAAIAAGKRAEQHGARFLDAPVSGSVRPAASGELVALVGGLVKTVERARPILSMLCSKIIHAGGVGQGQALKVVLNGVGAHHLVGFTSMLALAERAGLARDIVLDAFTTGAFATPSYVGKRDKLLARDYTPDFSLELALKDCALARLLQEEVGVELPVHRAIFDDVARGVDEGLGKLDLFALEKHYGRK